MRSWSIVAWGTPLEERTSPTPAPHGDEVLVRVERCGVCHSDVHIRDGFFDLGRGRAIRMEDSGIALPFTMGHEIVGTVAALGDTATTAVEAIGREPDATAVRIGGIGGSRRPNAEIAVGSRVVVYPWMGCGTCAACRDERDIDCERNKSLGTRRDGGYADHVLVTHPRYLLDYGTIDPNVAATCACSGLTAYSALRKLPPMTAGDTVLLIGAGGLGLTATGLAPSVTPARVAVTDLDETKLAAARAAGAAVTFAGTGPGATKGLRKAVGGPVRAVIDFVGSPQTVQLGLDVVARGGTVVIVGLFGGSLELSTALLPMKSLTLSGSYVGSLGEMRELLALVSARTLPAVPITTRPMSDVNAALDDLQAGKIVGRVVVTA